MSVTAGQYQRTYLTTGVYPIFGSVSNSVVTQRELSRTGSGAGEGGIRLGRTVGA
jgi:hypothetical protein